MPTCAPGSASTADDTVLADHLRQEVEVEVVAQERPLHPARLDVFLGAVVIAAEGEGRVGCGAVERGVDDVAYAGPGGRIHEGLVLVQPVGTLGRRDHEQRGDPFEGLRGTVPVVVPGELDGYATLEPRDARDVAHQQALADVGGGDPVGDPAPEGSGRTGDGKSRQVGAHPRSVERHNVVG
jgi:hypothetical protein